MNDRRWFALIVACLSLSSCSDTDRLISTTRCQTAVAVATQTWEVEYYISKTSGGLADRRIQSFQRNSLTNLNGEKPADAVTGPDDDGVWWAAIPPRPTADQVDQYRQSQERNDQPSLQRSVDYQLQCQDRTLATDALLYREVSRAIRTGQTPEVTYVGNRALKVVSPNQSRERRSPLPG